MIIIGLLNLINSCLVLCQVARTISIQLPAPNKLSKISATTKFFLVVSSVQCTVHSQNPEKFLPCVEFHGSTSISQGIYSPENSSYTSTILFSIQNIRFVSPSMPKPSFIVFGGGSLNYRDLDLEVNGEGNTSYEQGRVWGVPYFGNNFDRLVRVKSWVDPGNFFTNEQYLKA